MYRRRDRTEEQYSAGYQYGMGCCRFVCEPLSDAHRGISDIQPGSAGHNSMYLFLPPVMYFLFRLLLYVPGRAPGWTRDVSMIVYIIHPGVLIVLRGIAGAAGLDWLLAKNAFVQFISVSAVSFAAAVFIDQIYFRLRIRKEKNGNA